MSSCSVLPVPGSQLTRGEFNFLQSIVNSLVDGVLIVSTEGKWIYGNYAAHRICQQLALGKLASESVPASIWQVCQTLLRSDRPCFKHPAVVESEITSEQSVQYRVRVQWLQMDDAQQPYLLVMLEDCHQAAWSRAIAEVQQYKLTARQAEVWLLQRTGRTYREIATELFVSLNTVKRHMKDIYAKQKLIQ